MSKKISELTSASSVGEQDVIPIVQSGTTKKVEAGVLTPIFTGTDGNNAGTKGLVPAPATTDVEKFLKSDGTWKPVDTFKELTSPVRIWDLEDGAYKLPAGCVVYYVGASSTSASTTVQSTGYLFVTHYSTTYKNFYILCSGTSSTRYLYNGYSTETNGAYTSLPISNTYENTSNKVTSISSSSTNTQYPSAKCVYDALNNLEIPTITYGTTDIGEGATLADGTFYFVYE